MLKQPFKLSVHAKVEAHRPYRAYGSSAHHHLVNGLSQQQTSHGQHTMQQHKKQAQAPSA
jgi:hypothetical protein